MPEKKSLENFGIKWEYVGFDIMETLPATLKPEIANTLRGPVLVFHGKWRPEYGDLLRKHSAVGVVASFYKNNFETEFEFLREFPKLKYFAAGIASPICLDSLYCLKDLRYFRLLYSCNMEFDFTRFPNLEAVEIPWVEGMDSIFKNIGLRRLVLQEYRGKGSDSFGKLKNLEALDLRDASLTEIQALATLPKLRKLRLLLLPRLTSFAPLGSCRLLEVLHVGRCGKATEISYIKYLERLKYLILATGKPVDSIEFIKPLKNLKLFNFDCIAKDGDLSFLQQMPNLAHTVFRRQRHYSHSFQEVQNALTLAGREISSDEMLCGSDFGHGIDDWELNES